MQIEEVDLRDEKELEELLKRNPDQIEKGLKFIANQVITPKGRIDLLCVDKEGVLTIVELKVDQDDDHFKQAINYYDWVFENIDWLRNTYQTFSISSEERPKIILVAKNFTDGVITSAKYFAEVFDIKLYTYKALKVNGETFVICNEVNIPPIREVPEKPLSIKEHLDYITDENVRRVVSDTINLIKGFGDDVEASATKNRISFKYKGRFIAAIYPRRESFVLQWKEGEEWPYETNLKRFERVKELIDEKIKKSFEAVGGKLSSTKEEPSQ